MGGAPYRFVQEGVECFFKYLIAEEHLLHDLYLQQLNAIKSTTLLEVRAKYEQSKLLMSKLLV